MHNASGKNMFGAANSGRFGEIGGRRFGTGRDVSAIAVENIPATEAAQIELIELLQVASDVIGPVNQFTVWTQGNIRIQLKFNWTQEKKLDTNYEPHKRLILLLDGHKIAGKAIFVGNCV
jgi:hypothetical protein